MKEKKNINVFNLLKDNKLPTPPEIMDYLNQRVIGQDEVKKRLSVAIYNHYKRVLSNLTNINVGEELNEIEIDKSNIILNGPTGSGKTFIIKNIAKMLGVPCHIHDCTKLTQAGYVGEDVENILTGLLQECDYNIPKAEIGIVCLDEIDKIAIRGENMSLTRDVSGEGVQQSLLKIIEGDVVGVMPQGGRKHPEQELIPIDTSNILFIGMGAFVGLDKIVEERLNTYNNSQSIGFSMNYKNQVDELEEYEKSEDILDEVIPMDLKKFGLIPELIGRFPIITHTKKLTKEDMVKIIKEPKNSILKQYQKLFALDGKKLIFDDKCLEIIAETAITSETGARGIRGIMETILLDYMFDSVKHKNKEIKISAEYSKNKLNKLLKIKKAV